MVPFEKNILGDNLLVPDEGFDLLLEVGELMNYSDQVLKIIPKNIKLKIRNLWVVNTIYI